MSEWSDQLFDRGVYGLYIYQDSGLPVFSRLFDTSMKIKETIEENLLIGAFLSSIIKLTEYEMTGYLSDIGFKNYRFYIEHSLGLFFVLMIEEEKFKSISLQNIHLLLKGTLSSIKNLFFSLLTDIDENLLQNPGQLSILHSSLSNYKQKIEKMIFDSFNDTLDVMEEPKLLEDVYHASKLDKFPKTLLEQKEREETKQELKKYLIETLKEITDRFVPQ